MKMFLTIVLTVSALLGAACFASAAPAKKPLIIYFSWSGNARAVAQKVQKSTGGDLFEVQPSKPYPTDYSKCCDVARKEQNAGARPALKVTKIPNLAGYDTVILGTPCWWGDLPMPVFTLLEANDLAGKSVAQYMTHGGSGLGRSESTVRRLCPRSKILRAIAISDGSQEEVDKWLRSNGLIK